MACLQPLDSGSTCDLTQECGPILRPLHPDDQRSVRRLCDECFPITYPDSWFSYILSKKVFSLGVFTTEGCLMGMIVAEVQPLSVLEDEGGVLLDTATMETTVMYIISLGVHSQYRHRGLGTLLVNSLLSHIGCHGNCKIVYLHVLATNNQAIDFYRRLGFKELATIPEYYNIRDSPADGLLYCCYVNGGQPFTGSIRSYIRRYITESALCGVIGSVWTSLCLFVQGVWHRRKYPF